MSRTCLNKHFRSCQSCSAFGPWMRSGAWDVLSKRPTANKQTTPNTIQIPSPCLALVLVTQAFSVDDWDGRARPESNIHTAILCRARHVCAGHCRNRSMSATSGKHLLGTQHYGGVLSCTVTAINGSWICIVRTCLARDPRLAMYWLCLFVGLFCFFLFCFVLFCLLVCLFVCLFVFL